MIAPCIPFTTKRFILPYETSVSDFIVVENGCHIVRENVILDNNPKSVPTTQLNTPIMQNNTIEYAKKIYPSRNVELQTLMEWQGLPMACFEITPFRYDAETKNLYFIDSFTIDMHLGISNSRKSKRLDRIEEVVDIAKGMVENPEDVENVIAQSSETAGEYLDTIEYLLITTTELEPAFRKLVNWKKSKGIYANIVTLDQIESWYNQGSDIQEHIKHCLYDVWYSYGLKYVVFGGDDTIVPKRSCYTRYMSDVSKDMPVDKYYVCFNGDFNWDGNGNKIYGELDDNIDLTEFAYISRIPIRTIEEAEIFIDKLIAYERGDGSENWEESILTAGLNLFSEGTSTKSDAESKGDIFYETYISPYWNGERVRFYDTSTDFSANAAYDVTAENLQVQLASNHMFFSMETHGSETEWVMEKGRGYNTTDALNVLNYSQPIITTMACNTNAFDSDETKIPCLSEGFIRGENNGVVAYLGSSRLGWGYRDAYILGKSLRYEGEFYKNLFSEDVKDKNFGKLVSYAKKEYIPSSFNYNTWRWLQYSLNAVGDSEMPIFIHSPKVFDTVKFYLTSNGIEICTGVEDCRISIMSTPDIGAHYYKVRYDTSEAIFNNLPDEYTISITKQGYKPYMYSFRNLNTTLEHGLAIFDRGEFTMAKGFELNTTSISGFEQNVSNGITIIPDVLFDCTRKGLNAIEVQIGNSDSLAHMTLLIYDVFGNIKYKNSNVKTRNTIDCSFWNSGLYVVVVELNDSIIGTKKIVK